MAGRARLHRNAHNSAATQPSVTKPQSGVDLSLLQTPMELSITGALQVARCLSGGTAEMQELLTEECDIIFECRVCRNLFRNLPNFIAHKRHYCQQCYSDTKMKFVEPKPQHETLLIQPEAPKQRVATPKDNVQLVKIQLKGAERRKPAKVIKEKTEPPADDKKKDVQKAASASSKGESRRVIETEGTSDAFKFYTNIKDKVDIRVESMKRCLVELEDVQGNHNAKKQKVIINAEEKDIRAVAKKQHNPSLADLAIVTQSFESEDLSSPEGGVDTAGPRRISLRQRSGGGEVQTPIAEKLAKRKDCDVKTQTCLKCKAKYSSLQTLHFHMMYLHSEKRTFYPCVYSKCTATFTNISVAVRHLLKSHDCNKKQIDKLKDHLKKFAYTRPVDELGEYEKVQGETIDLALLKARKRKRVEEGREKMEKVKKQATDTVNHVTKRLSEKMKKPKDTSIDFGSGFTLYKCQNCSKAFAKEDSLNRHKAFCFGLGALGIEPVNVSLSSGESGRGGRSNVKTVDKLTTKSVNSKNVTKNVQKPMPKQFQIVSTAKAKVVQEQKSIKEEPNDTEENMIVVTDEMPITVDETASETVTADSGVDSTKPNGTGLEGDIFSEKEDMGNSTGVSDQEDTNGNKTESQNLVKRSVDKGEVDMYQLQNNRWATDLSEKELEKIRKIINEEELQCLKCNRKYGNVSNLHRHAFRHLGWKRFRCTLCDFTGYNRSECKTHLTRVHLDKSDNNPNKFILDLEPEKMKEGVSKRSRVESKRQSSLRVLQKMQEVRRERAGGCFSPTKSGVYSPTKRGAMGADNFNISTRNSPRAFDIRPYQRMEHGAVLFTRSGHYPKPIPAKRPLSDDESESNDSAEEELSANSDLEKTVDDVSKDQDVPEENGIALHIDNVPSTEECSQVEGQLVCESVQVEEQQEEPTHVEDQWAVTEEPLQEMPEDGDLQAAEVIYLYVDSDGQVSQEVTMTTSETTVMQTVAIDTNEQLSLGSGDHSIYVINQGLTDGGATADPELMTSMSDTGLVEEVIDCGDDEMITTEVIIEGEELVEETTEVISEVETVSEVVHEIVEEQEVVAETAAEVVTE